MNLHGTGSEKTKRGIAIKEALLSRHDRAVIRSHRYCDSMDETHTSYSQKELQHTRGEGGM